MDEHDGAYLLLILATCCMSVCRSQEPGLDSWIVGVVITSASMAQRTAHVMPMPCHAMHPPWSYEGLLPSRSNPSPRPPKHDASVIKQYPPIILPGPLLLQLTHTHRSIFALFMHVCFPVTASRLFSLTSDSYQGSGIPPSYIHLPCSSLLFPYFCS